MLNNSHHVVWHISILNSCTPSSCFRIIGGRIDILSRHGVVQVMLIYSCT
jgi:hypothetical protein